jgi:polar amino acid transport system substrate-binding protein
VLGIVGGTLDLTGIAKASTPKSQTLRVAFIDDVPLSYINTKTGKLTGSGPAVLRAIAPKLGITSIHPILTSFGAVIPGLLAQRWDMSAFPFYITPVRCTQVAFTNPTAQYLEGAIVKKGNPKKIHSYKDFKRPGITVALESGSAEGQWAEQNGLPAGSLQQYPTEELAIIAVREGRADVYLNGLFGLQQSLTSYGGGDLELAKPFTGPIIGGKPVISYGGWALRANDTALRIAFDEQLKLLNESGELLKLQAPYGYSKALIPPPNLTATSPGLCPAAPWRNNHL